MIDGKTQWNTTDDRCYLPIFVADPGQSVDVFTTWFLGNMFMDRYVIVHDMEGADDIGGQYKPRIGIYDKKSNMRSNEQVELSAFLQ